MGLGGGPSCSSTDVFRHPELILGGGCGKPDVRFRRPIMESDLGNSHTIGLRKKHFTAMKYLRRNYLSHFGKLLNFPKI